MYTKGFDEWIRVKEKLHFKIHKPPLVSEGEIWWASLGENVGWEMNGKSKLFSRPVIIYKKLSRDFYLAIPITTKEKLGTWFTKFKQSGKSNFACLHQIRTIDFRRLFSKLGELDQNDFQRIKREFINLYT